MRVNPIVLIFSVLLLNSKIYSKKEKNAFDENEIDSTIDEVLDEEIEEEANEHFEDISPDDILNFELEPWEDITFYQDITELPYVIKGIYFVNSDSATKVDLKVLSPFLFRFLIRNPIQFWQKYQSTKAISFSTPQ